MNIYIISAGEACKIGVAKDVDSRIISLRTGSPVSLAIEHSMKCKSSRVAYKIEKLCHRILAEKRLEGEWFACMPMDAVMALNEAVLEFASNDYSYIDMPRGGELALSSKSVRYVKAMCVRHGLKVSDIVDEAIVEHFGPIVDGGKARDGKPRGERDESARSAIIEALKRGGLPASKLRTKKGVGVLDGAVFDLNIKEMVDEGYIEIAPNSRGKSVSLRQKQNSEGFAL